MSYRWLLGDIPCLPHAFEGPGRELVGFPCDLRGLEVLGAVPLAKSGQSPEGCSDACPTCLVASGISRRAGLAMEGGLSPRGLSLCRRGWNGEGSTS